MPIMPTLLWLLLRVLTLYKKLLLKTKNVILLVMIKCIVYFMTFPGFYTILRLPVYFEIFAPKRFIHADTGFVM